MDKKYARYGEFERLKRHASRHVLTHPGKRDAGWYKVLEQIKRKLARAGGGRLHDD